MTDGETIPSDGLHFTKTGSDSLADLFISRLDTFEPQAKKPWWKSIILLTQTVDLICLLLILTHVINPAGHIARELYVVMIVGTFLTIILRLKSKHKLK